MLIFPQSGLVYSKIFVLASVLPCAPSVEHVSLGKYNGKLRLRVTTVGAKQVSYFAQ